MFVFNWSIKKIRSIAKKNNNYLKPKKNIIVLKGNKNIRVKLVKCIKYLLIFIIIELCLLFNP